MLREGEKFVKKKLLIIKVNKSRRGKSFLPLEGIDIVRTTAYVGHVRFRTVILTPDRIHP